MPAAVQGELTSRHGRTSRVAGTVCAVACGLSTFIFLGFIVFGIADHDIAGAAVVGTLAAALFIDIAVLTANWASSRARLAAYATWGVIAIALLGGTLQLLTSGKSDADLLLTYGTAMLAFPCGLIAGPIASLFPLPAGPLQATVIWAIAIGAGCLQWFVFVPMLLKAREDGVTL